MREDIDRQIGEAREELKRVLRETKTSQRAVEERCGWSRGYLSQVFQGRITLTLAHILAILGVSGRSTVAFFQHLTGEPQPLEMNEIRNRLDQYDAAFDELRRRGLISDDQWWGKVGEARRT